MAKTLEFVFDFSSTYGYLGGFVADQIAAEFPDLDVLWRPYLMGVAMKETGLPIGMDVPIKGTYMNADLDRTAALLGVPLVLPEAFPFLGIAPCRAFYALERSAGQDKAQHFARSAWEACFGRGEDITKPEALASAASEMGNDTEALLADMQDQAVKDHLREMTGSLIQRGCWGSPHFIVDGQEMYWGVDKRWELREYLRKN